MSLNNLSLSSIGSHNFPLGISTMGSWPKCVGRDGQSGDSVHEDWKECIWGPMLWASQNFKQLAVCWMHCSM